MNLFVLKQEEISALAGARHSNPHHILGMHECLEDLYVNAYIPGASSVSVVDVVSKKEYVMEQMYEEGFYTVKLIDTKPFSYKLKVAYKVWGDNGVEKEISKEMYDAYAFSYSVNLSKVMDVINGNDDIEDGFQVKDLFGARYIDMNGVPGVSFCMNMPGAVRVSVVGDFNHWDGRVNPMRKIDYTDMYELFIPEKLNKTRYKFEALYADGRIDIFSDPYAVAYEIAPGNASLLTELSYQWHDLSYMEARKKVNISDAPVNIYEVHMPTWNQEGGNITYKEFGKKLASYMKNMSYNYVSFLPLMEYSNEDTWGYDTTGIFAPSSRFGTPDDFMAMVDLLHGNGIGVIMDMVPVMDIDCLTYWIDTYHLDGIRLDRQELVNRFNAITNGAYHDVMIGCKWNTAGVSVLVDFMTRPPQTRDDYKAAVSEAPGYVDGADGIVALSHDEVAYGKGSFIEKMSGGYEDKYADLRVLYGLYMTMPGHKLMFMGQEIGLFGGFTGKTPIDWSMLEFDANQYIQKYVKDLNKLYMTEPLLYSYESEKKKVVFSDNVKSKMAVFERGTDETGNGLYVVCNFGIKDIKDYRLKVNKDGKYRELLSSDNLKYGGSGNHNKTAKASVKGELVMNVPALSISIIKKEK